MATESPPLTKTTYRSCNLCEAICGLTIEHDGNQVLSIKGDKEDPLSRGHICPKAIALQDIHADPDRLKQPMRRTDDGFKPISWEEAFDLVESKLTEIRQQHGDDSVGFYLGNPTVHNSGAMLFQGYLKESFENEKPFRCNFGRPASASSGRKSDVRTRSVDSDPGHRQHGLHADFGSQSSSVQRKPDVCAGR